MAIRITQNSIAGRFTGDLQSIYSRMAKSQQQLSDGRRITRPSDDPNGAGKVMGFDTQLADVRQYLANVGDAMGVMGAADSALNNITTALQAIRELATQAANGTNGSADLQSIASQIAQLKESVRDGLNAQYGDQYLFSGTASNTPPYPTGSNAYAGTPNTMSKRTGANQSVQVNVAGTAIVGPDGANTLDLIDQLVADVTAGNNASITADLGQIIAQTDLALDVRTQIGARAGRLESLQNHLAETEERLLAARSEIADVDSAEAYMQFSQQQSMYQAALAAGTRMMQTSILDFIR